MNTLGKFMLEISTCSSICKFLMIDTLKSIFSEPLPLLWLLQRSPLSLFLFIFITSVLLLLSWLVLLQWPLSRFGLHSMICFEHIYQFSCCRQLRFKHSQVLSPDSIVSFKKHHFMVCDCADFSLMTGFCHQNNWLRFLKISSPILSLSLKMQ